MEPEQTSSTESEAKSEERKPRKRPRTKKRSRTVTNFVYVLTVFATVGGFLFGYDTGIISGSMLLIRPYFGLTTVWTELIVSGTVGSAAIFSPLAGYLADKIGRRKTIMTAGVVFMAGAIIMGTSLTKEMLFVGRIVVGAGIGIASVTVVVYVAEVAPKRDRGHLVTYNQLFITFGALTASIVAGLFSPFTVTGWRYMLGLGGIPALIQVVGFIFLPETPRWLLDQGREEEARDVFMKIWGPVDAEEEMALLKNKLENSRKTSSVDDGPTLIKAFKTPHVRKALFVGSGLQFFSQTSGINTIIYYSASIMTMAGFPLFLAVWLVVVPNSIFVFGTFIGMYLVDSIGRRPLLIWSMMGLFLGLAILATGFQLAATDGAGIIIVEKVQNDTVPDICSYGNCDLCTLNPNCGFCYNVTTHGSCLEVDFQNTDRSKTGRCSTSGLPSSLFKFTYGFCPNNYSWMPIFGMAIVVLSFAAGLGPIPWAVNAEIYPLWARGSCAGVATMVNWLSCLLVSLTFLTLAKTITRYGTFWLYSGMAVLGLVFTVVFLKETKSKSLEEIEKIYMSPESEEEKVHFAKPSE